MLNVLQLIVFQDIQSLEVDYFITMEPPASIRVQQVRDINGLTALFNKDNEIPIGGALNSSELDQKLWTLKQ